MRCSTLVLFMVLTGCSVDEERWPLGGPDFGWGPAGSPLPAGQEVAEIVGDWKLYLDVRCTGGSAVGLRVAPDGTSRFLSYVRGELCMTSTLQMDWSYRERVLTFAPDERWQHPQSAGRMRVEAMEDGRVLWTQLEIADDGVSFGVIAPGGQLCGASFPLDSSIRVCDLSGL